MSSNFSTYHLSKHLVFILSPYPYWIRRFLSKTVLHFLVKYGTRQYPTKKSWFHWYLFIYFCPHWIGLTSTVITQKLQQDQNLSNRTNISKSNIIRLSEFVLKQFLQIQRSTLSTNFRLCHGLLHKCNIIANQVLEYIEEKAISTVHSTAPLSFVVPFCGWQPCMP